MDLSYFFKNEKKNMSKKGRMFDNVLLKRSCCTYKLHFREILLLFLNFGNYNKTYIDMILQLYINLFKPSFWNDAKYTCLYMLYSSEYSCEHTHIHIPLHT